MAYCHIYARQDGRYTVRMSGSCRLGTVEYTSREGCFKTEEEAREWIDAGVKQYGLRDIPEPRVVRRVSAKRA